MIDGQPGKCGIKSNVWTGRLILIVLPKVFSIDDGSPSTVYRTMHRLGKTYRKPGWPHDRRTPSDEVKAGFKEDLVAEIVRYVSIRYYLFWMDESHLTPKTVSAG